MSGVPSDKHVNRLVAVAREEVASQERIAALLERQEASVRRPGDEEFQAATAALETELAGAPQRASRRDRALRDLAAELRVAPSALTIGSVVERLGDRGAALAIERDRLRDAAREVQRRNRRVATLVRLHRQVTKELIQVVLGPSDGGDVHSGGSLIDAEV